MEAACFFKTWVTTYHQHLVMSEENVPFINGAVKISNHTRILMSKPSDLTSLRYICSPQICIKVDTHGHSHATNFHLVQNRMSSYFDNWCTNKLTTIIWNVSEMPKSIRFFLTLAFRNVINKPCEMKWQQLSNRKSISVKRFSEQTFPRITCLPVHAQPHLSFHPHLYLYCT